MTMVAPHITAFLRQRLTCENTRVAYAYAFQLLFTFASKRLSVAPSNLRVEDIDAPLVLAFLDHIQAERGNGAHTRNTRLAAIRSFMRFVEYRVLPNPLVLRQIGQAAPVFVYGRVTRGPLDGQWTNLQSLANGIWCSVTMNSSKQSVAKVTTWKNISGAPDQSGINVVEAVADGQSSISLTVENNSDGPLGLAVTVDTTPAAEAE